jgi:hypothetical protein
VACPLFLFTPPINKYSNRFPSRCFTSLTGISRQKQAIRLTHINTPHPRQCHDSAIQPAAMRLGYKNSRW